MNNKNKILMVVALLEWLFIPPLLFFMIYYLNSIHLFYPKVQWEEVIKTYNLLELLKSKFIIESLVKYNVFVLNFVLNHLPLSFNVGLEYVYPIYVRKGYVLLPLPSNYRIISISGQEVFSCVNTSIPVYVYRLNQTGFVCINLTNVTLLFDPYYNLIPFIENKNNTCLYTKSKIIYAIKNYKLNVSFYFNYSNFSYANAQLINITESNLKLVFINYTGYAYVILGEGNFTKCNLSSNFGEIYFPLEMLNVTTIEIKKGERIPIKYKNFYYILIK